MRVQWNAIRAFVGALGMAGLLTGCGLLSGAETYRYRITVEVDTPQGMRSGSSVWEVSTTEGSGIPDRSIHSRVRGEAVAVDLPGGTLFALLRGQDMNVDYPAGLLVSHLRAHPELGVPTGADWSANMRSVAKAKPAFELYPDEYPLMVRFRDIKDPASVEKVEPAGLAASFGAGVTLRRIVVAVTNDGVTDGIETKLPWLEMVGRQRGSLIPNPPRHLSDTTPIQLVAPGDFSTELYQ